jgi:hypothetical protein
MIVGGANIGVCNKKKYPPNQLLATLLIRMLILSHLAIEKRIQTFVDGDLICKETTCKHGLLYKLTFINICSYRVLELQIKMKTMLLGY